ncbi:MAG TPA: DEAD/DEAH box helicase family protein [Spirochaetales bacterium]|nr:DEAD/DEAH box helicase family protein [Spirochaetales bacterium]
MNKLYLQNIVENYDLNNLPQEWLGIDLEKFSSNKKLFDYQQNALKNFLKALYLYFNEDNSEKNNFYQRFLNNGLTEELSFDPKKESKTIKYLLEYDKDYPIENDKISFKHFINRMSFWMATGSGKTLVIVKLIELLGYLILNNKIPKKDILFLTYREDLIEQFKEHIKEFNQYNNIYLNLIDLKNYSSNKQNPTLKFGNSIDIYYYRSDLISDKQKDKIIDYKNYDNNGNWYILLDEAHKGDREDSKRQIFYNILSRNGFLFNFSATFTDPRDYATCVFNFNLAKFIEDGYGKHIYISQENISVLEKRDNHIGIEKQKIILKIFILQTAINELYEDIKKVSENLYHRPLLLTLVNSVNTTDSDLELFFKEIEKIALGNQLSDDLLKTSIEELKNELSSENAKFVFEEAKIDQNFVNIIEQIKYSDILKYVFNSDTFGKIEILKIPSNKQELVFKLKTTDKPFALMKIGDISEWIKNKLSGYEIVERFENESTFKNINNSDEINILMGSRSFYEGWDSNRPNIILFITIGKGNDANDARKFVLQAVGRGVRIEPVKNKRKRGLFLYNNKELDVQIFNAIKDNIEPLESLFVYGTKSENLKEVIETLKQEKTEVLLGDLFEINPDVKDKLLLIPVYKESNNIIVEEQKVVKFSIHPNDYELTRAYFIYLGDKVCLVKYDCNIKVLQKLKEAFNGKKDNYFLINNQEKEIKSPEFLLGRIFKHFENKAKEFYTFKKLEEEIIHFKRINISTDKLNHLREKIEKVKKAKDKESIEKSIDKEFDEGKISKDEYKSKIKEIESNIVKEAESFYGQNERLKIKYLANHYYLPIALTETERADFIQHIIKHKSEVDFINELENYLQQENNFFKNFDWWYFSKIDESLDEVYIPYYQPKTNRIEKFKPDFIFWLKKGNNYIILFIDPKGTEHTDGYRKIDGYSRIFETVKNGQRQCGNFQYNGFNIITKLLLKPKRGIADVLENYKQYWFDTFDDFANKIQL